MPTEGGRSIPGAIARVWQSDKPDVRWADIDPNRTKRLGSIWGQYDVSADPANNADYLAAYAAQTPKAKEIAGANVDWLSKYATGAYDPTESYAKLLGLNKEALGTFLLNPALSRLTKERKARQAAAGYGGAAGTGTYDSLLDERILQQLASEAIPNLLGNTTAAYGTAGRLGQENFLNRMGIIGSGEQYRQLDTPALRYLEPTRLARSDVQANLGALGAISSQEDKNRAYYRKRGSAERIADAFDDIQGSTNSELNDILDLAQKGVNVYTSAYSGGLMGGGGGAGKAAPAGGAGGGGGNQNQAAIINYLLQMYGNQGGARPAGSSPYTYDPNAPFPG